MRSEEERDTTIISAVSVKTSAGARRRARRMPARAGPAKTRCSRLRSRLHSRRSARSGVGERRRERRLSRAERGRSDRRGDRERVDDRRGRVEEHGSRRRADQDDAGDVRDEQDPLSRIAVAEQPGEGGDRAPPE